MRPISTSQNISLVAGDNGKAFVFTGASGTWVLPPPIAEFAVDLLTFGTLTLVPGAGLLNNAAQLAIPAGTGGRLESDGVNWFLFHGTYAPAGQSFLTTAVTPGATGLTPTPLPLLGFHNTDGSALSAAAAAGKFGFAITLGTSFALTGEAATGATKTDDALAEFVLPPWYIAGQNLTATVNAALTGTGTAGTKTVQVKAYRTANAGTQGANLGGAAQAITAAGADVAFTITGATLNPGDRILFEVETVLQETGGVSSLTALINSLRVS